MSSPLAQYSAHGLKVQLTACEQRAGMVRVFAQALTNNAWTEIRCDGQATELHATAPQPLLDAAARVIHGDLLASQYPMHVTLNALEHFNDRDVRSSHAA